MKIPISEVDKMEATRPGYRQRLLAAGKISDEILEISAQDYTRVSMEQVEQTSASIYFRPEDRGPGDIFAFIIRKVTGQTMCARCRTRRDWMNRAGWVKCWLNRKMIVEWLCEEAEIRGHSIPNKTAMALFKAALKELHQTRIKQRHELPGST